MPRLPHRRAGQREAPPVARPRLERSDRAPNQPGKIVAIRGLPTVADSYQQTEAAWRATWADELAARGGR